MVEKNRAEGAKATQALTSAGNSTWNDEETETLLDIFSEKTVQHSLDTAKSQKDKNAVYRDVKVQQVLKFSRVLEQGKELTLFGEKCEEAFCNQLEEYNLKRQKGCARESPTTGLDRQKKKSSLSKPSDQRPIIRRRLIPKKSTDKENFAKNNIFCDMLFDGSQQESRRTPVTEVG